MTGVVKEDEDEGRSRSSLGLNDDDPLKLYDRYDFFDPILFTPVSLRDKMMGTHASGKF